MTTRGIWIPIEVINDKNTTFQEKLILMEINQLSMLDDGCVASNSHFAKLFKIKKESVSRAINSLQEKGYISIEIVDGSRNHKRIVNINKLLFGYEQNVIGVLTNCLETKDNKTINKTINKTYTKKDEFLDENDLYKKLSEDEKDLFLEYMDLRKTLKLKTTLKIQTRLLKNYFEYGRDKQIIIKAINANWKDFYPIKQEKPRSKSLAEINREALDNYEQMFNCGNIIDGEIE